MMKVVAAVTFGAVARSKNQNFTVSGGEKYDGMRARTPEQLTALSKYSDRLRDYCHPGDPICAVGSTPVVVMEHLNYFEKHNQEVVAWVTEKATASSEKVCDESNPNLPNSFLLPSSLAQVAHHNPSMISPTERSATNLCKPRAQNGVTTTSDKTGSANSWTASFGYTLVAFVAATLAIAI
jgi:hypothetical protein